MPEEGRTTVSSRNQSGGITARTVNIHTQAIRRSGASGAKRSRRWKVLAAIVTALASITAVLQFLGFGPLELLSMADKPNANISSTNQSGGITAHTVNIGQILVGPQRRQMTPEAGAQIKQQIPASANVRVATLLGDSEAIAFATQIREWMLANGYSNVGGVDLHGVLDPVFGQFIRKTEDGYQIFVGTRE